jgi:hypothetical protein
MDVAPNVAAAGNTRDMSSKTEHGRPHGQAPAGKSGHAQSFLALTALGVVPGDIGTSPLYAFSVALNAVQSARSGALCDRKPDHALHRVGRRIPGSDRR